MQGKPGPLPICSQDLVLGRWPRPRPPRVFWCCRSRQKLLHASLNREDGGRARKTSSAQCCAACSMSALMWSARRGELKGGRGGGEGGVVVWQHCLHPSAFLRSAACQGGGLWCFSSPPSARLKSMLWVQHSPKSWFLPLFATLQGWLDGAGWRSAA